MRSAHSKAWSRFQHLFVSAVAPKAGILVEEEVEESKGGGGVGGASMGALTRLSPPPTHKHTLSPPPLDDPSPRFPPPHTTPISPLLLFSSHAFVCVRVCAYVRAPVNLKLRLRERERRKKKNKRVTDALPQEISSHLVSFSCFSLLHLLLCWWDHFSHTPAGDGSLSVATGVEGVGEKTAGASCKGEEPRGHT